MSFTSESCSVAANSPWILERSPRNPCDVLSLLGKLFDTRLQIALENVGLTTDLIELLLEPSHEALELGADRFESSRLADFVRTSSRMMAPKPQQMTSRKDKLNPSNLRR